MIEQIPEYSEAERAAAQAQNEKAKSEYDDVFERWQDFEKSTQPQQEIQQASQDKENNGAAATDGTADSVDAIKVDPATDELTPPEAFTPISMDQPIEAVVDPGVTAGEVTNSSNAPSEIVAEAETVQLDTAQTSQPPEQPAPQKRGLLQRIFGVGTPKVTPLPESPDSPASQIVAAEPNPTVTQTITAPESQLAVETSPVTPETPAIDRQAILTKFQELLSSGSYDQLIGDEALKQAIITANTASITSADSLPNLRASISADINRRLSETGKFKSRQDQLYLAGKVNQLMDALLGADSNDGRIVMSDGRTVESGSDEYKTLARQRTDEVRDQQKEVSRREAKSPAQRMETAAAAKGEITAADLVPQLSQAAEATDDAVASEAQESIEPVTAEAIPSTDAQDKVTITEEDLANAPAVDFVSSAVEDEQPREAVAATPENNGFAQELMNMLERSGEVAELNQVEKDYLLERVTSSIARMENLEGKQITLEAVIKGSIVDSQLNKGSEITAVTMDERIIDGVVLEWTKLIKGEYGTALETVQVQTDEIINALQNKGNQEGLRALAEATKFVRESNQIGANDTSGVQKWFKYKLYYLDGLCKEYVKDKLESVKLDESTQYYQGYQELKRILKAAYGDTEISDSELSQIVAATAESQLGKKPPRSEWAAQRARYRESEKTLRAKERQKVYSSNEEKARADIQAALEGIVNTAEKIDSTVRSVGPAVTGAVDAVGTYLGKKLDAVDKLASKTINATGQAVSGTVDVAIEVSTLYPAALDQVKAGFLTLRTEATKQIIAQISEWWTKRSKDRNKVIDAKIAQLKGTMAEAQAEVKLKVSDGGKLTAIQRFARSMGRL